MKRLSWKTGLVFLLLVCLLIFGLILVFLPKNSEYYYKDDNHYDVVFFGTSECFTSFDPAIFDGYGIDSYNRARRNQPLYYTYYYVQDAIDACDVDTVVIEIHDMVNDTCPKDELSMDVVDSSLNNMRFSKYKFELIKNCIPDDMHFQYYFPLDKYHGRWEAMAGYSKEEWQDYFTSNCFKEDRGYQSWNNVAPLKDGYPSWEYRNEDYSFKINESQMTYLNMIYETCMEKGVNLVLVKSVYPCNDMEIGATNQVMKWAEERDVPFVNFMNLYEEIGMIDAEDDSDEGYHMNLFGARKVSNYMAQYLLDNDLY